MSCVNCEIGRDIMYTYILWHSHTIHLFVNRCDIKNLQTLIHAWNKLIHYTTVQNTWKRVKYRCHTDVALPITTRTSYIYTNDRFFEDSTFWNCIVKNYTLCYSHTFVIICAKFWWRTCQRIFIIRHR